VVDSVIELVRIFIFLSNFCNYHENWNTGTCPKLDNYTGQIMSKVNQKDVFGGGGFGGEF
jgi:hypothetical protein